MNFPKFELTNAGISAVLAGVYGGSTITFTGVKLGSGNAPANIKTMTDIVTTVATVGITDIDVDSGKADIEFLFNNNSIVSGFYLREIGIMAKIDDGNPFLYAYSNSGSHAGYVKPYDSDTYVSMVFNVYVAVGDAEHVTAIISEAVGYVSTEEFEAHTGNDTNPHQVTKEQVGLGNVPNLAPSDMTVTFTQASTLTDPTTGSTLATLMGILSKAVNSLRTHLTSATNPHNVTYSQVGAAAASHTHSASDFTSGVLDVWRGGTGVTSYTDLAIALAATVAETKSYLGIV